MLWPAPPRRQMPRRSTTMPSCWPRWPPCLPTGPEGTSKPGHNASRILPTCMSSTSASAAADGCTSATATTGCSWPTLRSTVSWARSSGRSSTASPIASGVPRVGERTPTAAPSSSVASTPSPSPSVSTLLRPAPCPFATADLRPTMELRPTTAQPDTAARRACTRRIGAGQHPRTVPGGAVPTGSRRPMPVKGRHPATARSPVRRRTRPRRRGGASAGTMVGGRSRRAIRSSSSRRLMSSPDRIRTGVARFPASARFRRANWSASRVMRSCSACCSPATASRCGTGAASGRRRTPSVGLCSLATVSVSSALQSRPGASLTTLLPGRVPVKDPPTSTIWPCSARSATTDCTTTSACSSAVPAANGRPHPTRATPSEPIAPQDVRPPPGTVRRAARPPATHPHRRCRSTSRIGTTAGGQA